MLEDNPLISVIIAVYNGERYLADALDSVLAQAYRPLEVIVVDDGSTDSSAEVAARYAPAVRCYRQANGGVGAALNFGIAQSAGDFLAFLDADDLWTPDKLARQMPVLTAPTPPDIVFGHAQQFLSEELTADQQARLSCPESPMPGIAKGTLLLRRREFLRVGPFETSGRLGDFMEWYLRACEAGLRAVVLPEVLLRRRIHDTSMGTRKRDSYTDYVQILKASLDRRRAMGTLKTDGREA